MSKHAERRLAVGPWHGPARLQRAPTHVDLDGDGTRDVLLRANAEWHVARASDMKLVHFAAEHIGSAPIVRWNDRPLVFVADETPTRTPGAAPLVSGWPAMRAHGALHRDVRPSDDGRTFALEGDTSILASPGVPALRPLEGVLAGPLDASAEPIGPVRIDGDVSPDLLVVSPRKRGPYTISVLTAGANRARVLRTSTGNGFGARAWLLDLEGDGRHEVLVSEDADCPGCRNTEIAADRRRDGRLRRRTLPGRSRPPRRRSARRLARDRRASRARDACVFEGLSRAGVPVAWNLAGDYQVAPDGSIPRVLEIHDDTALEHLRVFGRADRRAAGAG